MKSVMLSIQPKWCELIATGEKTVEVRKTKPKIETPFKCFIYCTKSKNLYGDFAVTGKPVPCGGKVIGEFVCDKVMECRYCKTCKAYDADWTEDDDRIDDIEFEKYANKGTVYGWHIRNLVIYDKPKELSDFITCKWLCNECDIADIRESNSEYRHCIVDCGAKCVTRPPQSWRYVEVIE